MFPAAQRGSFLRCLRLALARQAVPPSSESKMKHLVVLTSLVLASLATGCASMASFQTADTVGAGEVRQGVGVTYNNYTYTYEDSEGEEQSEDISVPALHGWYRYGLTDELELHTMVWIPLGATAGMKYQLLGGRGMKGLSLSLGADAGYLKISSGEGEDEVSTTIVDTHVPVYVGYRLSKSLAGYLTPRYLLRASVGEATNISHLTGAALGVALGDNTRVHLEGVGMYDLTYGTTTLTAGVGISF